MYKNKMIWATIGSKFITNMSHYKDLDVSEDEVFELIANGEYLLDDSEEIYGKKLINFLKIWDLIRNRITEAHESYREFKIRKWAFTIVDYREIYLLLDEAGEYEKVFNDRRLMKVKIQDELEFFERLFYDELNPELFMEDLLTNFIRFSLRSPLGIYTKPFVDLLSNSMAISKGYGPIFATYSGEMIEFSKQVSQLIILCKGLPLNQYNRVPNFQKCCRKLLDMSENNRMMLESL